VAVVERMELALERALYNGLAAINFEFLAKAPAEQSGIAKAFDRAELNAFVATISRHLYSYVLTNVYYYVAWCRYGVVIGVTPSFNAGTITAMLPAITPPKRIDLITANIIGEELKQAKDAGVYTATIVGLNKEYAMKQFEGDEMQQQVAVLSITHDPLPNLTADEKATQLMGKSVREVDVILSNYVLDFVKRALSENENFAALTYTEQRKVLEGYAQEYVPQPLIAAGVDGQLTPIGGAQADDPKAKLRGTVGGLTGIIEIVNAVATGVYDLDSAVELVKELYGFDDATARRIIGTPSSAALEAQQQMKVVKPNATP
jgi:hypothetical protein